MEEDYCNSEYFSLFIIHQPNSIGTSEIYTENVSSSQKLKARRKEKEAILHNLR
jgi:hypothetical protein